MTKEGALSRGTEFWLEYTHVLLGLGWAVALSRQQWPGYSWQPEYFMLFWAPVMCWRAWRMIGEGLRGVE